MYKDSSIRSSFQADALADKLIRRETLEAEEFADLIDHRTPELAERLAKAATDVKELFYGKKVYIRGLIEISNYCQNNCYYCGIRSSNLRCDRYRLSPEEILVCAAEGYEQGFRTFVLQGGEDPFFTDDRLCTIIREIKDRFEECAVTLSLGERSRESYQRLYEAGADRYLLRHETADPFHYRKLHPESMSFENRMRCLQDLKEIGFQTGCGFMVGSPFQSSRELAEDLVFIRDFKPDMCGVGPFVPHAETPFGAEPAGTAELTCFLLSLIRLIHPPVLLPATTALATCHPEGREKGILAGANVVMPNLSPKEARGKYILYDRKIDADVGPGEDWDRFFQRVRALGFERAVDRGDIRKED